MTTDDEHDLARTRRRARLLVPVLAVAVAGGAALTATPAAATAPATAPALAAGAVPASSHGGWTYVSWYPDPLICHIVAAIYYPGRQYECYFDWFLWHLRVR